MQRQQDMLQHQQSQGHWLSHLETAPTFYPTPDEFQDPIAYIRSIQTEGSKHGELAGPPKFALRSTTAYARTKLACSAGICKIVPPLIPTVPSGLVRQTQRACPVASLLGAACCN